MLLKILFLFTVVPFVELLLLFKLSEMHGWQVTISLVIITGIVGTLLARQQGFLVWQKIQREMSQGKPPTDSLIEGLILLIAGAFLITPGILTDACGFLLLLPWLRQPLARMLKLYLLQRTQIKMGQGFSFFQMNSTIPPHHSPTPPFQQSNRTSQADNTIDVEYKRVDPES